MGILSQKIKNKIEFKYTSKPVVIIGVENEEVDLLIRLQSYIRENIVKSGLFTDCDVILLNNSNLNEHVISISEVM